MRPLLRTAARPLRRAAITCLRLRASSTGALWTKLNELGARPGAINMGQGFPDFAGSAVARDAAKAALDVPALNQYAPINGLAELRAEIRNFYERSYGSTYEDDEVVVTTSGQEALVAALKACFTEERRGVGAEGPLRDLQRRIVVAHVAQVGACALRSSRRDHRACLKAFTALDKTKLAWLP